MKAVQSVMQNTLVDSLFLTQRKLRAPGVWYQRVKVENFILRSSGPHRVQRHQCYATCWGRSCCKMSTVPYLPIRPLQFTGGSPKRVKVENFLYILRSSGPRRVHRHQCYATYWGMSEIWTCIS